MKMRAHPDPSVFSLCCGSLLEVHAAVPGCACSYQAYVPSKGLRMHPEIQGRGACGQSKEIGVVMRCSKPIPWCSLPFSFVLSPPPPQRSACPQLHGSPLHSRIQGAGLPWGSRSARHSSVLALPTTSVHRFMILLPARTTTQPRGSLLSMLRLPGGISPSLGTSSPSYRPGLFQLVAEPPQGA